MRFDSRSGKTVSTDGSCAGWRDLVAHPNTVAESSDVGAKFAVKLDPSSVDARSNLDSFCLEVVPVAGQNQPRLGQIGPRLARLGRVWPKLSRRRPRFGRLRGNLAELGRAWPTSAQSWPSPARFGRDRRVGTNIWQSARDSQQSWRRAGGRSLARSPVSCVACPSRRRPLMWRAGFPVRPNTAQGKGAGQVQVRRSGSSRDAGGNWARRQTQARP